MTHIQTCPRCLFDSEIAEIGEKQCSYCDLHDTLESQSKLGDLYPALERIRRHGRRKKYDCLIGISGGLDSATLLYFAIKNGLRPLVIHFDNGWNNAQAEANMKNLIDKLNVNAIIYKVDKREYDNLNKAFLHAGTPDADIPNDIAMTKLMYQTASKYGIKWILNGHDFRTEGSTPAKWTYMDAKYIQDVYYQYTCDHLQNYPLFTFWDQIWYGLKGIKQLRPFHYGFDRRPYERAMKELIGWQDYGAKHCENLYTEFVGACLLPEKFSIDKRVVYLSAQVRAGQMPRKEAALIIQTRSFFDINRMGTHARYFEQVLNDKNVQPREKYARYNFKRWYYKWTIYLLAKFKVVPQTFYVKYCK